VRRRRAPVRAGGSIAALVEGLAPVSGLAALQSVWPQVAGEVVAAQAHPASEREGIVTVTCASSVWAQELTLMAPELTERLNAALQSEFVRELRFRAAPAGAWAKAPAP
jgi:predicted nucleic acid-binding Zn ribbon protein